MRKPRTVTSRPKEEDLRAEHELADFWRKQADLDRSDFDDLIDGKRLSVLCDDKLTIKEARTELGMLILNGKPLFFDEFHMAIGLHYLLTRLSYFEFYSTHWHETKDHRAYGPGGSTDCCRCDAES